VIGNESFVQVQPYTDVYVCVYINVFCMHCIKVQMSFVEENGGRLISNELSTGQAALFPKGLIHYQVLDTY
jgi:hypothetical protein